MEVIIRHLSRCLAEQWGTKQHVLSKNMWNEERGQTTPPNYKVKFLLKQERLVISEPLTNLDFRESESNMQTTQRGRRTPTIYYMTQKTGQIRMLLLEKNLAFVSFQDPSISIRLFQAGRYDCLFSRYLVEWQRVWLISCCWRPGPMKGSKKKKEMVESSHGSCSFFAWLALREAGYLADDKCSCTPSCLKTPADAKPWQPVRLPLPPPAPGLQPQPVLLRDESVAAALCPGRWPL